MKKLLTSFILTLAAVFGIVAMTPGVYAAHSAGIDIVRDDTHQERWNITGFQGDFELDVDLIYEKIGGGFTSFTIYADDLPYGITENTFTTKGTIDRIFFTFYSDEIEIEIDGPGGGIIYLPDPSGYQFVGVKLYFIFEVLDNQRPAIDGQENFVTSVDDTKPISFFQDYLSAYDETDGNITDSIYIVNDNYTPNRSTLGTWEVTFGVSDAAGNESTLTVFITVADITKPIITGNTSTVEISYTQTWNISNFRSTLTVTDNYASMSNSDITVKSDGYTSNKTNLGTYDVIFSATDPSGNEATFTKKVTVIDDVAPTFSGPQTLTKPSTSILTVADIQSQLSAVDVKDGNRTSYIELVEDNYTGNGNKVGSYTIQFKVSDTKGNTAYHTVTVTVVDNIPPVWYIQDGVSIVLVPPTTLTQQQIIDLLTATGQINVQATTQIKFSLDEYTGNESEPGVYLLSINLNDTAGNSEVHNLAVTVLEAEDDEPITLEPKPGFIDSTFTWIQENPTTSIIIGLVSLLSVIFIIRKFKK